MDRTAGRTAIAALLTTTSLFNAVLQGRPDSFGGKTPIAVVSSAGTLGGRVSRGVIELVDGWVVRVYVQRPKDADTATEDELDTLTKATIVALLSDESQSPQRWLVQQSRADLPNRLIDGKIYRVEEIPVTLGHGL